MDQALQDPGWSEVVPLVVHVGQPGQTISDHRNRRVSVRLIGLVVPGAAMVDLPTGEVVVAAPEVRGP